MNDTDAIDVVEPTESGIPLNKLIQYSIGCIIFGLFIGIGFYISLARYNLSINTAIAVIVILFIVGSIPAVFLQWWINKDLPETNIEDDE